MTDPGDKLIQQVLSGRTELPRLEDSVTPREELLAGILTVRDTWNEAIPRNRVRVLAVYRIRAIRDLLQRFPAADVCRAIRCYGRQPWQRAHDAWKSFDAAMCEQFVVTWLEEDMKTQEAAEARDDRARQAAAAKAAAKAAADEEDAAWAAMSRQAVEALVAEVRASLPAAILTNDLRVLRFAREFWRRKRAGPTQTQPTEDGASLCADLIAPQER